jgi:pimeloyl-ACP methyl ester carboxylesterase
MERHLYFENEGSRLLGALHEPDGERLPLGLVYLHGWAGYRLGPHQMFAKMGRRAAELGFCSLRFDFRGRGDSEGDTAATNLGTMISDAVTAVRLLRAETGLQRVAFIGDCSGSEVAIGAGPLDPAVVAQVLWSAPIVAGDRAKTDQAKRKSILSQYARKVFRKETWAKAFSGRLQMGQIGKVIRGGGKGAGEEGSASDREIDWLDRWLSFAGPRLYIYGGNDPTTAGCVTHYEGLCREFDQPFSQHIVAGANHAFYSLAWEDEVIDTTLQWLREHAAGEG